MLINTYDHEMRFEVQDNEQIIKLNWLHWFKLEYLPRKGLGTISTWISGFDVFLSSLSHVTQAFRIRTKTFIQRLLKLMEKLSLSLVGFGSAPKS